MPRIMLVDDDRNVLRSLARLIHFMPVARLRGEALVETFDRPATALQRAAEVDFDLVIADYLMPTMNGIDFLRRFMDLQPATPRMMLSGYANIVEELAGVREIEPVEMLAKPWENDALIAAIARTLPRRAVSIRQLFAATPRIPAPAAARYSQTFTR